MTTTKFGPTAEQTDKARIKATDHQVPVYRLSGLPGHVYAVPSCTQQGHAYQVTVEDDGQALPVCQCKGYKHRGICVHVGAVLVRLDEEAQARQHSACQGRRERTLEEKIADLYR